MSADQCALTDDVALLGLMLADAGRQPPLYQAGPYWAAKARSTAHEIRRCGLEEFRGTANLIGLSYADCLPIDFRDFLNHGFKKRLARLVTKSYPVSKVFDAQVQWTESYARTSLKYAQEILKLKGRTRDLLARYELPSSLLGGAVAKVEIDGQEVSVIYLNLLEQHDNIASRIDFGAAKAVFEIGGGFGVNTHLLLANYKNIRKVLYLDIPPNLYVGTQYLKAFYGTAVSDYRDLRERDRIEFAADDSLEIFCIAPWQIERCGSAIDVFMNSHSFVEMPVSVVKNYCEQFMRFPGSSSAALAFTTYDASDRDMTIAPSELPKFMADREFEYFEAETLLDSTRRNLYHVSSGKLAVGRG